MTESNPSGEDRASDRGAEPPVPDDWAAYNLPTDPTAVQTHLLCLIYRLGPTEGVQLQTALEELYPEDINHGRLYPSLDRMVDSGLVSKQAKESDKRRKKYELTGRGKWVAEEYLRFVRAMIGGITTPASCDQLLWDIVASYTSSPVAPTDDWRCSHG